MGGEKESRAELAIGTLNTFGLDVCGISEARWKGSGKRDIEDYTVYWSGNEKGGKYGVAIAVRKGLASSVSAWKPISDRLMWMRCNARSVPITIVQCYAPTDCSDAEA